MRGGIRKQTNSESTILNPEYIVAVAAFSYKADDTGAAMVFNDDKTRFFSNTVQVIKLREEYRNKAYLEILLGFFNDRNTYREQIIAFDPYHKKITSKEMKMLLVPPPPKAR